MEILKGTYEFLERSKETAKTEVFCISRTNKWVFCRKKCYFTMKQGPFLRQANALLTQKGRNLCFGARGNTLSKPLEAVL